MLYSLKNWLSFHWKKEAGFTTATYKGYKVIIFRRYPFDCFHFLFKKDREGVILITSYPTLKHAKRNALKLFQNEVRK